MESDLKSHLSSPHPEQGPLFHSTISSAAPFPTLHQIGQAPALLLPAGVGGLGFSTLEWKKELAKRLLESETQSTLKPGRSKYKQTSFGQLCLTLYKKKKKKSVKIQSHPEVWGL